MAPGVRGEGMGTATEGGGETAITSRGRRSRLGGGGLAITSRGRRSRLGGSGGRLLLGSASRTLA